MRLNVWAEEIKGDDSGLAFAVERVTREEADDGEVFDGIRLLVGPEVDGVPDEGQPAVTFWIPVDGYAKMGRVFYEAYQACVELSAQRSRD